MKKILKTEQSSDALFNTLLYSDIFNFPLKKHELWYFLKSHLKINKKQFLKSLKSLPLGIIKVGDYYCLKDRSKIVKTRIKREKINEAKYLLAKKTASVLSLIPTVYFVGISGSLAYRNAKKDDDIDFFIITKKNTMWVTRLVCLGILEIIGLRRKRRSYEFTDKICLNMFIEEKQMRFPKNRHDIYTAHEIAQLSPLKDKKNTYKKFIKANDWVNIYMPNVLSVALVQANNFNNSKSQSRFVKIVNAFVTSIFANQLIEYAARIVQRFKINKTKTSETVNKSLLAFHPNDYRFQVIKNYKEKLKDKNLYRKLVFANRLWYYFNMQQLRKVLVVLITFLVLFFPNLTYAQITPSPAIDPGCIQSDLGCVPSDVPSFVAKYYQYGLGLVGGFAVLMIIFGSYQILISRGNPKTLNDGKTIIAYAISGLLLAIFGYVFIEVIAKDILKIPGFT